MNSPGALRIMNELMGFAPKPHPEWPHPWRCESHIHRPSDCHVACDYRQHDSYDVLMTRLREKYGEPIGEGRHRITFESERVVIKMPKNIGACWASQTEYNRYKRKDPSESSYLAHCRLLWMYGVPVIIMVKLDTKLDYRTKPQWSWEYDAGQIGRDRKGNLKAYDYTTI